MEMKMEQPLVSVICLCYNHARFLRQALDSVLHQTYQNLEIIVVDDVSRDNSREIILEYARKYPQIRYLFNEKNLGNCAAFNRGYEMSKGAYLIDFATDDVLLLTRIEEQVTVFEKLGPEYGVLFTDAELIDDNGKHLGYFYDRNADGTLKEPVPQGEVFAEVVGRHFISTPTMLMRRQVFDDLKGYDATLAYEDFDFWVRSARMYKYYYLDKPLTQRRIHAAQLSQQQYKPNDRQIFSTITVCRKAQKLLRTETEKAALLIRVRHEFIQAVFTDNLPAAKGFYELLQELTPPGLKDKLLFFMAKMPLPLTPVRNVYYRFRHHK
jgi:glycosyltransferase involved in cell wall biosynthesis